MKYTRQPKATGRGGSAAVCRGLVRPREVLAGRAWLRASAELQGAWVALANAARYGSLQGAAAVLGDWPLRLAVFRWLCADPRSLAQARRAAAGRR